jgi:hypothetical protein
MERLESLSGYPRSAGRAVIHSHLRIRVGGHTQSVLSRVAPVDHEYTGRTNYFAHHVVLDPEDLPAGGPAWLLGRRELRLESAWRGEPRHLEFRPPLRGDEAPRPCKNWERLTGDAGWAGVLAECFEKEPGRATYLIVEPGLDPLPLLAEALALLPPERRWAVTFSTCYTERSLAPGLGCAWRCVPRGSEEAKAAASLPGTLNLCEPRGRAQGGERVEQARTGRPPRLAAPLPPRPHAVALSSAAGAPGPYRAASAPPPPTPPGRIAPEVAGAPGPYRAAFAPPPPTPPGRIAPEAVRSGSRVLPFLGGLVTGMVLMACAATALGYFLAFRPLNEALASVDHEKRKASEQEQRVKEMAKESESKLQCERREHLKNIEDTLASLDAPVDVRAELQTIVRDPGRGSRGANMRLEGWTKKEAAKAIAMWSDDLRAELSKQPFLGTKIALPPVVPSDTGTENLAKQVVERLETLAHGYFGKQLAVRNTVIGQLTKALNARWGTAVSSAVKDAINKGDEQMVHYEWCNSTSVAAALGCFFAQPKHFRDVAVKFDEWYVHRAEEESEPNGKRKLQQDNIKVFQSNKYDETQSAIDRINRVYRQLESYCETMENTSPSVPAEEARRLRAELYAWKIRRSNSQKEPKSEQ